MEFRIVSQKDEKRNPDIPPAKLGEVIDVEGHIYFYDDIRVNGIYPVANPPIILVNDDFYIERCVDNGCRHIRRKEEK